jgi:hypothetical protein
MRRFMTMASRVQNQNSCAHVFLRFRSFTGLISCDRPPKAASNSDVSRRWVVSMCATVATPESRHRST